VHVRLRPRVGRPVGGGSGSDGGGCGGGVCGGSGGAPKTLSLGTRYPFGGWRLRVRDRRDCISFEKNTHTRTQENFEGRR